MDNIIKQAVKIAAGLLLEDKLYRYLTEPTPIADEIPRDSESGSILISPRSCGDKTDLDTFVACANLALADIMSEYLPQKATATMTPEHYNGGERLEYANFPKIPLEITKVTCNGKRLNFSCENTFCNVKFPADLNAGELLTVEYFYRLPKLAIDEDTDVGLTDITARMIALDVAAEVCMIRGLTADSEYWHTQFKETMKRAKPNPLDKLRKAGSGFMSKIFKK